MSSTNMSKYLILSRYFIASMHTRNDFDVKLHLTCDNHDRLVTVLFKAPD